MKAKLNFKDPLTDRQIVDLCKSIKIPLVGVFMDDELQTGIKDGNYIVNLESSFQQGSHWCAFIKEYGTSSGGVEATNGTAYYFDPFGVYPDQVIHNLFPDMNLTIIMNDQDVQNIKSILCGYFCIGLFLYIKQNKGTVYKKFEQYLKMFNKNDTRKNDAIIKKYILRYFNEQI